jgi:hypothetical protein
MYSVVCFISDTMNPFFPECITACVSFISSTTSKGAHTYLSANILKKICSHTEDKIDQRLTQSCIEALVQLCYTNLDEPTLVKMCNLIRQSFGDTSGDLWFQKVSTTLLTAAK